MVRLEDFRLRWRATQACGSRHEDRGSCCRFCAFFIDFHECLANDLGNLQRLVANAAEIGLVAEGCSVSPQMAHGLS